jgi:hypothetical protein
MDRRAHEGEEPVRPSVSVIEETQMKKIMLAALAVAAVGAVTVPAFAQAKPTCKAGEKFDEKEKKCVPDKK